MTASCLSPIAYNLSRLLFFFVVYVIVYVAVTSASARNRVTLSVEFHTEIKAHSVEDVFDLIERFLAEILRRQHFSFGSLDEVTDSANVSVLQAIIGSH